MADTHQFTLYGGYRGPGKALALDTPVPTPQGWQTQGSLRVGDEVIGADGLPTRVVWVSPVWEGRPCHLLRFDDGEELVADAEHQWLAYSREDRRNLVRRTEEWRARRRAGRPSRGTGKRPDLAERNRRIRPEPLMLPSGQLVTTHEIAATMWAAHAPQERNWSIPLPAPFDPGEGTPLPIHPYTLGVWLGDGTATAGAITTADADVIGNLRECGCVLTKWGSRYAWGLAGLKTALRQLGVLGNKHIPMAYLRASQEDRQALLAGLLDSDGYVDPRCGMIEFTSSDRALAEGVRELALSLGHKATLRTGRATLNGRDCGGKQRVSWTPIARGTSFRLRRKADQEPLEQRGQARRWRYVVACDPSPSVPVRCIQVSSPGGMYLVGKAWIPTHNSYWLRWYLLDQLLQLARHGIGRARVGLFCETYPTLTDRQVGPIEREFPTWLGKVRSSQNHGLAFHVHPDFGGGVLALRNLDDPGKYKSAEFAAIGVDQLEQNTKETFDLLRGSLRWPGVARPRFVATANPGGIGHLWVKQLWIDRSFPSELLPLGEEFSFVEARPDDNPYLDQAYWQMLESLPEGLRQAWRYGNWDTFEGQAFSEWRREVHVIDPFAIPAEWPRFRALDYGYTAPSCVGWFAVDGRDWRKLYLPEEQIPKALAGPASPLS